MKQLAAFTIIFAVTFVLFDALVASAAVIVVASLMLIPGKAWLGIGEAFAEMMPWIMIANIDL
jgi:hypothetical protein